MNLRHVSVLVFVFCNWSLAVEPRFSPDSVEVPCLGFLVLAQGGELLLPAPATRSLRASLPPQC